MEQKPESRTAVCEVCFRRCRIPEGGTGACLARGNRDGKVVPLNYGMAVAHAQFPVADMTKRLQAEGVDVKFAIHPGIETIPQKFEIRKGAGGKPELTAVTDSLKDMLKSALGLPAVKLIYCGGADALAAQREQWSDAANVLAVEPGKVIAYQRNHITNDMLDINGIDVITISGSELSRGRGGTRCMCYPIYREDL